MKMHYAVEVVIYMGTCLLNFSSAYAVTELFLLMAFSSIKASHF